MVSGYDSDGVTRYTSIGFLFVKVFLASLILWGVSYWQSKKVPTRFSFLDQLKKEPVQTPTTKPSFEIQASGHTYQIEPIFDYEIWGTVVSAHQSDSFFDSVHESWNDYINTKDICIVWGDNVLSPYLSKMKFKSGSWTCYVSTTDSEAWRAFNQKQLSNNHVIPANESIQNIIDRVNVGDEIRMKGHLVNYKVNNGISRNSSTVRTDFENGACEIVYVKEFEIFSQQNRLWVRLAELSRLVCAVSLFAVLICFFILPFFITTD